MGAMRMAHKYDKCDKAGLWADLRSDPEIRQGAEQERWAFAALTVSARVPVPLQESVALAKRDQGHRLLRIAGKIHVPVL